MDKQAVLKALETVQDPAGGQLVSSDRLQIVFSDTHDLFLTISIDPAEEKNFLPVQETCRKLLEPLVKGNVSVTLTGHRPSPSKATQTLAFPDIKKIIAVASGKGGVGKSTIAFNLAIAAAQSGLKVGLIDADVYGPSLPMLIHHWGKPALNSQGQMIPFEAFGVKMQSMGFLISQDQPVIWRGPMAQSSFQKLLTDTAWEPLDLLFIDLPPGTGDIHLTLCQKIPLQGAVIVTTPQDLALMDALKAIKMFEVLKTPVLGLIENMSFLICPHCTHLIDVFGQGHSQRIAQQYTIPFLGQVPLNLDLRQACDKGQPLGENHALRNLFKEFVKVLV